MIGKKDTPVLLWSRDYAQLHDLAFAALSRTCNLRYATELREAGCTIRKFSGKKVVISLIKCFQGPKVLIPCKCRYDFFLDPVAVSHSLEVCGCMLSHFPACQAFSEVSDHEI